MNKPKVNEAEYAMLINNKMKEHHQYKNGMGVKLNPEGSKQPLGLNVIGGGGAQAIMAWAESELEKEYELVVTQRNATVP